MRKLWDIHGGIHPPENKQQSLQQGIAQVPLPDLLILPLNQHIGAPALPIVKLGDKVLKGQMIAEPDGFVSAAVHAPSSGTIAAIEDHAIPHPSGMDAPCIMIHPDGEERWCERQANTNYQGLSPEQLLSIIRNAGITGMGGASFPSSVKLQPRQSISTLIINATECEPYITADDRLIRERAEEIIIGIDILAHILGRPEQILIGIEDNKPEAYKALESALTGSAFATTIELVDFPTKYPSGGEKQLIQILTGQEVPSGKLPAELGIVCHNVGTAYAVYKAVYKGEPLISRITTVTGNSCTKPGNYETLIGTPLSHLLAHAGFDEFLCQRLIMGGPMMGYSLDDLSAPVIKSTNCLLAADIEESPPSNIAQACIRCGHCSQVCPANLLPQQLYWYARAKDYDKLAAHNLADCIECGACSYVCPSEIPLVQYYRAAKGEIRLIEQENVIADRARQRFEYHQERLLKAEEDRNAKREARKKAAELAKLSAENPGADNTGDSDAGSDGNNGDTDIIQAALARVSAAKASPEQELKRLQRALSAAQSRLHKAQQKLEQSSAEDSTRGTLEASLEQSRLRHQEAVNNLAAYTAKNNVSDTDKDHDKTTSDQDQVALDAAAIAIKNAQQKAALQADMSVQEKLVSQRDGLLVRLDKARSRLAQAESDKDENLQAFANAVTKLETKLVDAEASLAEADAEASDSETLNTASLNKEQSR
jgi:electron transport complex protein RnfC